MEVKRVDLYDFEVTLNEEEFNNLRRIADYWHVKLERVVSLLLTELLKQQVDDISEKET